MKPKIDNQYPIIEPIANRWSPRAFADKAVTKEDIMPLFEAARWAASCFNEQPWRFKVGIKGEEMYDKIFNTLGEFNQNWVKTAPVVVLVCAKKAFDHNGKPNAHSWYDSGQAVANLATQATANGLYLHQMAGFDRDKAEKEVVKDDHYDAICVFALGHLGNPDQLPDQLKEKEEAKQQRLGLDQIVSFS
ncbi:nitroreductase family protein [Fulvivirga lutea]|uniref:Nitroreductase family protein n=1 Tax=Fulvivirga lutea TaxID=2810512 RepID=A0A974ZZN9_9BACT|nr:nitroreductase family protein [Fulvivirga lutea]QSE96459.1 nitroreductase family protein [Fulvivirga lutea]